MSHTLRRRAASCRLQILPLEDRLAPAAFTPGNVAIYRVGSGTGSLVNTGNPVFIDEYTPTGTLVQSIAMPTTASGAQKQLVASGAATSEGSITRSSDGQYLVFTGYASNIPNAGSLSSSASTAINRTIGRVSAAGVVDTSTALTDYATGSNPRSVASTNGNDFWIGGGAGGVRYTTLGSTTSLQVSTSTSNVRTVGISNGQLYTTSGSGVFRLATVGTGTPTTSGQTITNLPGTAIPALTSPYGFFFADLSSSVVGVDTVYVADDETSALSKFTLNGTGNWVASGTVGSTSDDYFGVTGVVSGTTVTLYATRGNQLVSLVDSSGYNGTLSGTPTVRATAAANTAFRGIALAPSPNNAPVLTAPGNDFTAINEDDVTNAGTLVSALIAGRVTDADAGALSGIAVTATDNTGGTWQYSLDGTTWNNIGTVSDSSARLLPSTARARFVPNANSSGAYLFSFTFRAWDQTTGLAGSLANTSPNGGTTAFSTNTASSSITVNPVNDAPSGTDKTLTLLEDTSITITAADFGFSDPNDVPPLGMDAVRITTLPALGTLRNNGSTFAAGTFISIADLLANRLTYTPVANGAGTGYASFTFQVQDGGGTANGGVDLDQSPNTITFNVTPVNDPPAGTDGSVTTNEDTPYAFTAANFGFTDPVDSPANALAAVRITTIPSPGVLRLNGTPVTAGQTVSVANINSGLLTFTPATNASGTNYASFTFQVQDNGGTVNSGIDLDASPNTMTINVTSVNDAPSGTDKTATLAEDGSYTITVADLGFSDPNDTPANTLQAVRITTLPTLGTLRNNGSTFAAGTFISLADLTAGNLVYTPALGGNGSPYATFTFQVQDDGGTANTGVDLDPSANTFTFNVTPKNSAPAGTDGSVSTLEDTPYTFTTANFGFTDPLDTPSNALLAVRIATLPVVGLLTNDGNAVSVGQFIPVADITGGKLVYTPATNGNGPSYASFTFQVQDDGGTVGGGVDLDASPNTLTINVTPVNDAPSGSDMTVTTNEDTPHTFTTANFGFSDSNDVPPNLLSAVIITTLPANGSLTNDGAAVTAGQSIPVVDINDGKLVFTPATNANGNPYTTFTFQVQDGGGTANGGANLDATPNTLTIRVNAVNDAPSGTDTTVSTNEDTAYTFTTTNFGFSDANDTPANTLQAVRITTLPTAGTLTNDGSAVSAGQFIPVADITGGKLVFTPATNASGSPYTTFTFQVQDNGGGTDLDATPNTLTINVTSVNDAPSGTDTTVSTNEDTQYTFTTTNFGFTDVNDSPANTLQAVRVTTLPALGSLTLSGSPVTAGDIISVANITAGNLRFTPAPNANGSPYTTFTFQVQDNGGITSGGVDLDVTPNTLTVNVVSVNDAPAGTDTTVSTNEDTPYIFTTANFGFSDVNDSPANTLQAVLITTLPALGSLTNDGNAVSAGQFIPVADITGGKLRFTPVANASGTPYTTFTFQVQDNGTTANGGVDLDASANTLTINVGGSNDAPSGTDTTVSTNEDTPYTFTTSNFGFTDPNDSPAHTLQAVRITTLPALGTLTNDGNAVSAGQFIPVADITGGKLRFTPATNANGSPYTTFTFQVQDNGGTASGGVDMDQSPNTMTVNVVSVNDAPAGTDTTVTTNEDTPYIFTTANFGFTDPNDAPANTLQAVRISILPTGGTLTLSGNPVAAGDFISVANITAGNLRYTPATNGHGTPHATFGFQVQDNGTTANGGVDLDATPNTMSVNVVSVNDAPSGADTTVSTNEDTPYIFTSANFGFTDVNDSPANTLQAVRITTLPVLGSLTNDGNAVSAGEFIPVADITGGKLRFTSATNANGSPYTTFTFQVQDNGGITSGGVDLDASPNTLTLNVVSVNDAPAGTDTTVSTNEDTPYVFTTANFGFSDVNDSPANTLQAVRITSLPALGTLTNDGNAVSAGQFIPVADITGGKLRFTPVTNGVGSPYTTFTFQVQDNGTTANGGVDLDPTPNTLTINVGGSNDAPSGTDTTVSTNEDTPYTFTTSNFGFTDPNDAPANTLQAVRITTLPALGSLTNDGNAVSAGQFIPVADITGGKLRFTPATNASGTPYATFTFQVQDNGSTSGGGVDLDPTPNTLTINVASLNDAPSGTDTTVSTNEDTQYTFTTANFGFTDVNDSPANTLQAVRITTLPALGSLTLSGSPIAAGDFVSVANITAGNLRFTPATNANGSPYTTFTFQVQDNGGTASGGVDVDQSPNTMTVNVVSVNDAPAGTDTTVSTNEDTPYTFTTANFGFTDPNDAPANTLQAVHITSLPALGTLTNDGNAVSAGQFIPVADITGGKLRFTPATNASGTPYTTFTFQVQDNGGITSGGVDLDATPNTLTVNVVSVNDAPAGANNSVSMLEDMPYTFTTANFGFTDPNDTPANTLQGVRITTLPALGSLTLNSVAVTVGQTIAASAITAGNFQYTPALNGSGSNYTSFTFQVQDNGTTANGGVDLDASANTLTLNVTPVNDAPSGLDNTVSTATNTPYTFTPARFTFTDALDVPANALQAVRISTLPALGTLTLNSVPVSVGQTIAVGNIASGQLVYTPLLGGIGIPYTSFTFQVQDNGGTSNGGVDLDATPNTMTINVSSLAPTATITTNLPTIVPPATMPVIARNVPYQFTVSNYVDNVGQNNTFSLRWDWDGDGVNDPDDQSIPSLNFGAPAETRSYAFPTLGVHTVRITITDNGTNTSTTYTLPVEVRGVAVGDDGKLDVGGTTGPNVYTVDPGPTPGSFRVFIDGVYQGVFGPDSTPPVTGIHIHGQDADDTLTLVGTTGADDYELGADIPAGTDNEQTLTYLGLDVTAASIENIVLRGSEGGDRFTIRGLGLTPGSVPRRITIEGGNADDVIYSELAPTALGPNNRADWIIEGPERGSLEGVLAFNTTSAIVANGVDDHFKYLGGSIMPGTATLPGVTGGAGTNTVDLSSVAGSITIFSLDNGQVQTAIGHVADVDILVGTAGTSDKLIGATHNNTWDLTTANGGTYTSGPNPALAFSGIELLTGGSSNDAFNFFTGGSLTGALDGGSGTDALRYPGRTTPAAVKVSPPTATSIGGSWTNIESLEGGNGSNTLTAANGANVWTLTSIGGGTLNALTFANFGLLVGGTNTDQFKLGGSGGATAITGGSGTNTLSYAGDTTGAAVMLTSVTTGSGTRLGSFTGISSLVGGSGPDSLTGTTGNDTFRVTAANTGNVNTSFLFSAMEHLVGGNGNDTFMLSTTASNPLLSVTGSIGNDTLVGQNLPSLFDITGSNSGTLNLLTFSTVENLTGGTGNDTFQINGGSLTGTASGGNGTDTLNVGSGGFVNLANNTATGMAKLSGFEKFVAVNGTITGPNLSNVWRLTGSNAGTLNTSLSFNGFANVLGGTAQDRVYVQTGGVTGVLHGGGGTDILDYVGVSMTRPYTVFVGTLANGQFRTGLPTNPLMMVQFFETITNNL